MLLANFHSVLNVGRLIMGSIGAKTAMMASTEYFTILSALLELLVEDGLGHQGQWPGRLCRVGGGPDGRRWRDRYSTRVSECRTIEDNSPSYVIYKDVLHKLWGDHVTGLPISTCIRSGECSGGLSARCVISPRFHVEPAV